MPELPEVETVRRGLAPAMVGARFSRVTLRRANLRFPFPERFAARLEGRTVTGLARRAKYLTADLDSGETLIMHLGMSGRFDVALPDGSNLSPGDFYLEGALGTPKHDHVVMAMSTGATVTYNDARRFGFMDLVPSRDLAACRHFAKMGIEPLDGLTGAVIAQLFRHKVAPLKAALLDQRLIAGLGNIYARPCTGPGCTRRRRPGAWPGPTDGRPPRPMPWRKPS
jgi:formamidopyrimidine-DNA glycosylase